MSKLIRCRVQAFSRLHVAGMNSTTIYMAQAFIGFRGVSRFFLGGLARLAGRLFLYFLYRKKVFLEV